MFKINLKYLIASIQIIDIAVHVITGQIEPIRIIASLLLLVWLFAMKNKRYDYGVVILYVFLNSLFLFQNGILNDGSPRVFFLVAVISTLLLSWKFISNKNK